MILIVMIVLPLMAAFAGIHQATMPQARVETTDPTRLHLSGEFMESNLGTVVEPDGAVTVRAIGQQYSFTPGAPRRRSWLRQRGHSWTGLNARARTTLVPGPERHRAFARAWRAFNGLPPSCGRADEAQQSTVRNRARRLKIVVAKSRLGLKAKGKSPECDLSRYRRPISAALPWGTSIGGRS
jgi:hypothetical protein